MQPKANNEIKPKSNIYTRIKSKHFRLGISLLLPRQCFLTSSKWLLNVKKFPLEAHSVQRELAKDLLVEVAKQFRVGLHVGAQSEFIRYHILRWYSCEFIYYSVWSMCACDTYAVCDHTGEEGGGGRRIVYKQYRETSTERINRGLSKIGYSLFGHYIIFFFLIVRIIVFCYV